MKSDLEKTQHYTTDSERVCGNLVGDIPANAYLVEPFVGAGDLVKLFPNHNWDTYDIDDGVNADHHQDTLLEIPNYNDKWVITNPPFLAKNKASDKRYFLQSQFDDLYKISLDSIIGCNGGIIIVPLNFLTDEDSKDIRNKFLSKYKIIHLNVFTVPVFKTTSYSVCSFSFIREDNDSQDVDILILPENRHIKVNIQKKYGYRIAGEDFVQIEKTKSIYNRLTATSKDNITNMKLYALDTRDERIHIDYDTIPFIGKNTDRIYLTFTTKKQLTEEQQKELITEFNLRLNQMRDKYGNIIFTTYRDWNRKRIGFTFAYKLLSLITEEKGF